MQQGMLSFRALKKLAKTSEIETVCMVFTDMYGRFMGKRLDIDHFINKAAHSGITMCDYIFATDIEMNTMEGYQYSNWDKGFGDITLKPDLSTLRIASWLNKTALVICDAFDEDNQLVPLSPRTMLQQQILKAQQLGFTIKTASELEYHSYKNSYEQLAKDQYHHLEPLGWYKSDYHMLQGEREEVINAAVRRHLKHSGIQVENTKGECGIGQHELNLVYDEVLTMADHHKLFKHCIKEVADAAGLSVSFMAKPSEDGAGCSCHVHLSLWQKNKNAFVGDQMLGSIRCSDNFRWFLGGWIKYVPELMVFYAPTINSYKRYQAASWAPTSLAWSYDNRTAGFRIVGKNTENLRIECRIPGADCNPYLLYSAVLASGLAGIENQIEPPDEFTGDAYQANNLPKVPSTLYEAVQRLEHSDFAQQAFGENVVNHYLHFFQLEQEAYNRAVTDWERQRYFERI